VILNALIVAGFAVRQDAREQRPTAPSQNALAVCSQSAKVFSTVKCQDKEVGLDYPLGSLGL